MKQTITIDLDDIKQAVIAKIAKEFSIDLKPEQLEVMYEAGSYARDEPALFVGFTVDITDAYVRSPGGAAFRRWKGKLPSGSSRFPT